LGLRGVNSAADRINHRAVSLGAPSHAADLMPTITGTAGNDTLVGTAGIDQINGLGGDDVFNGPFGSADIIDGGDGTDGVYVTDSGIPKLRNVEFISLAGASYTQFTLEDATIAAGLTLAIDVSQIPKLPNMASFYLDGSSETDGNLVFQGGAGTDYIIDGAGNDVLNLGDGDNIVYTGAGDDVITGGNGLDLIFMDANFTASDQIDGGGYATAGDVVSLKGDYSGARAVTFSATTMVNVGQLQLQDDFGYDLIFSDATISAGSIFFAFSTGSAGIVTSHVVKLDASADTDGRAFLGGGSNNDILRGGRGDDELVGFAGDDILTGGAGKNTLYGYDGFDTAVFSGARSDYAISYSSDGRNVHVVGNGEDSNLADIENLQFSNQNVTIATPQSFVGTNSYDHMIGWGGNDTLSGLDGDDWLTGGSGDDVLDGGSGFDIAEYDNDQESIVANLITGTAVGTLSGHDTLIDVEGLYTLGPNSTLIGNDSDNSLYALAGAHILAGGGNDVISIYGPGASIDGGDGFDQLTFHPGTDSASQITFTPGAIGTLISGTTCSSVEKLNLSTGSGGDTFTFQYPILAANPAVIGFNSWDAGGGNDTAIADMSSATDSVILRDGPSSPQVFIGSSAIIGFEQVENYWIRGGIGNDQLVGYSGDDFLIGGGRDDMLRGAGGDDRLRGDSGINSLDGGAGIDTAIYARTPGSYVVTLNSDGSYTIKAPDATDTLIDIEQASFDGTGQTLSMGDFAAQSFNPLAYIASYTDLIYAFGNNQAAAMTHYMNQGYYEGRTAGFNALKYTASYADLVQAFGNNQTAALNHYVTQGYREARTVNFNALNYVAAYPDLIQAFGTNQMAALNHYVTQGYYEGRGANFNALEYIASYTDLIQSYGTDQSGAVTQYITEGYFQGRTVSFSALAYTASYSDLIHAFGNDQTAALKHYITQGIHEDRFVSFSALNYTASYGDLINAFGTNQTAALNHYVTQGFYENRVASFDPVAYLLTYQDLQNAGYTAQNVAGHYIAFGSKEARTPDGPFDKSQVHHALVLDQDLAVPMVNGCEEWFSINLTAGHSYDFSLWDRAGSVDTRLELHNANGVLIAQDGANGGGSGALIHYTASGSGPFYLVTYTSSPMAASFGLLAQSA
jgi:Ca2+-binding RTX toxin-like protein